MKQKFRLVLQLFIAIMTTSVYFSCQKSIRSTPINDTTPDQVLINQAHNYFNTYLQNLSASPVYSNLRNNTSRIPDWNKASVLKLTNLTAVSIPIHYVHPLVLQTNADPGRAYKIDDITHLLIFKDSTGTGSLQAELITLLPDSTYKAQPGSAFKGLALVDHWDGSPILRYLSDGNTIQYYDPNHLVTKHATSNIVQICLEVDGYNYSPDDPSGGESWTESAGCTTYFLPIPAQSYFALAADLTSVALSGGSGKTAIKPQAIPTISIGHNIIADIQSYFECFQDVPDATYQVTVCVDQPIPGTRTPWTFSLNTNSSSGSNAIDPGHTFLIFTENNGGNIITRNIGFYPSKNIAPTSPTAQGALNNDEAHSYNISGSFNISNTFFFNMISFVSQGNSIGYNYDLDSNNCTTFAISALVEGHIYLPSTTGYWLGGMGNDPGDFGEDLRNSNAPGIIKSTLPTTHPNIGSCN